MNQPTRPQEFQAFLLQIRHEHSPLGVKVGFSDGGELYSFAGYTNVIFFFADYALSNLNITIVAKHMQDFEPQLKVKFRLNSSLFGYINALNKRSIVVVNPIETVHNQAFNTDRATFRASHRKWISQAVARPKSCAKELSQKRRVKLMLCVY